MSTAKDVRKAALATLYVCLRTNFESKANVDTLQVSLTVSLSKLVPSMDEARAEILRFVMKALPQYVEEDPMWSDRPDDQEGLLQELEVLIGRLRMILEGQIEIQKNEQLSEDTDQTYSEHLLMQIADAFSHMVEIRVQWLNRLAEHHLNVGNHAEAAICFIEISRLEQSKLKRVASRRLIRRGSSSLDMHHVLPEQDVISALVKACDNLDKADLWEKCHETYKDLISLYEAEKNHTKLAECYRHLVEVQTKLADAAQQEQRFLGRYYRVGFYGPKFGERLNGKEFIYKMPKLTQLSEISRKLKQVYEQQLGVTIRMLPDSSQVQAEQLNANEHVLQVTFLQPYAKERSTKLDSFIDKNSNIHMFRYSTPFTKDGAGQGSISEQYKRITTLSVELPFPWLKTVQEVTTRQEEVLNPIQAAIEDIDVRTKRLTDLLSNPPASDSNLYKALTGLLAGSVNAQVNGGSAQIALAFLNNEDESQRSRFSDSEKNALRDSFRSFFHQCQRGLDKNAELTSNMSDVEKQFQDNLNEEFTKLTAVIQPLLSDSRKRKGPRKARFAAD